MRIGIIGTGLIGGSLALALRASKKHEVFCYNRKISNSQKAIKLKAVYKYFESIEELAQKSDVIIIATPLSSYADICKKIAKYLDGKKIISDVGSVQLLPAEKARAVLPTKYKSFFVPAHPIAGKEKGGIENADAKLYKGKRLIITKTANCKKAKIVAQIWKDAGASVEFLNPKKHDEIYAYVSHYVQFLSHILAKSFTKDMGEFSRLMGSSKDMWAEIFFYNQTNLKKIHKQFQTSLLRKLKYITSYKGADEFEVAAKIIADAYVDIIPVQYSKYAGSGFKSFTSVLNTGKTNHNKIDTKKLSKILNKVFDDLKKAKL